VSIEIEPSRIRSAFAKSASWFDSVVGDVGPDDWKRPGLGSWTVHELVGHTSHNYTYVLELVVQGQLTDRRVGPFAFWDAVLAGPNDELHATIAGAARAGSESLGDDPASAIHDLATRTLSLVDRSSDDAVVRFATGKLALIDYLPSRIVEFVCHGVDLCEAIDRPTIDVPRDAVALTAELLAGYADPLAIVKVLVGRNGSRYSVFEPER
jgi:uncharacterized protein (TIGR03083 family)